MGKINMGFFLPSKKIPPPPPKKTKTKWTPPQKKNHLVIPQGVTLIQLYYWELPIAKVRLLSLSFYTALHTALYNMEKIFCYCIATVLLRIADCQGPLTFTFVYTAWHTALYNMEKRYFVVWPWPKKFWTLTNFWTPKKFWTLRNFWTPKKFWTQKNFGP